MKKETISICMIEDYFLTRVSYKRILSKEEDFRVFDFENAGDCLNVLENNNQAFDVVLMDLGLPGINGIEATRRIKEKYPDIKVIILTTHECEEEVLASLASGADGYVLKDIEFDKLAEIIRMVNNGAIWLDPDISYIHKNIVPKPNSTDFNNLYNTGDDISALNSGKHIKALLTEREYQALKLLVEGKSNVEIARDMTVSVNTAKAHVGKVLEKLSVTDRVQAAVKAVRARLF